MLRNSDDAINCLYSLGDMASAMREGEAGTGFAGYQLHGGMGMFPMRMAVRWRLQNAQGCRQIEERD
jgi:hypothetical protein